MTFDITVTNVKGFAISLKQVHLLAQVPIFVYPIVSSEVSEDSDHKSNKTLGSCFCISLLFFEITLPILSPISRVPAAFYSLRLQSSFPHATDCRDPRKPANI